MSSTAYESPLYAVPDLPTTRARFAALLALRDGAHKAFDKALSLPRSAISWVVSMFQRWVEATGTVGVVSWLGAQARNAAGLFRKAGIVPSVLAVLSTSPVAAAATRLARFVGNGLRRLASAAWRGVKGLLGRCGSTGTQIVESLGRAGTHVADALRAMAAHPVMVPVAQALRATLALVRPISQGLVAHRLLGALVPILWLRTLIGLLVMPLLVDTALAHGVRVSNQPATPANNGTDDAQATGKGDGSAANHGSLLIDAFGPPVPTDAPAPRNGNGNTGEEDPPLNRASRRAQQRDDAQARRTRPRH